MNDLYRPLNLSRRTLLRGSAIAGAGLAGLPFAGAFASGAAAAVAAPSIIACPTWGARAPGPLDVLTRNPNKILIHHTAGPNSTDYSAAHAHAVARSIQNHHMDVNGWTDSGQHFTVSRGGHVLEARHHSLPRLQAGSGMVFGSHCPDQNDQAIGIENEGTYTTAAPTSAQYNSLVQLCAYICAQYGLPATAIFGHRDYRATACPGDRFYGMIPQLRADVAARMGGGDRVGLYRPGTGTFFLEGLGSARLGDAGLVPIAGDWNRDGVDSIGVYKKDNQTFYLKNSNTSGVADGAFRFGNEGDIPLVGDWDGDGYDTIAVYRPDNQTFYLKNRNDNSGEADGAFRFGSKGDIPLAGNWDGDQYDTIGVYRPDNQTFYLKNRNDNSGEADGAFRFGNKGDLPVVGNWDGDAYDTIGVYRPGTQSFYLKNRNDNSGEADIVIRFGERDDLPISGRWR
ncbi:hypothetical protein GCM10009853_030960 [Glycomyces scopariae]